MQKSQCSQNLNPPCLLSQSRNEWGLLQIEHDQSLPNEELQNTRHQCAWFFWQACLPSSLIWLHCCQPRLIFFPYQLFVSAVRGGPTWSWSDIQQTICNHCFHHNYDSHHCHPSTFWQYSFYQQSILADIGCSFYLQKISLTLLVLPTKKLAKIGRL